MREDLFYHVTSQNSGEMETILRFTSKGEIEKLAGFVSLTELGIGLIPEDGRATFNISGYRFIKLGREYAIKLAQEINGESAQRD